MAFGSESFSGPQLSALKRRLSTLDSGGGLPDVWLPLFLSRRADAWTGVAPGGHGSTPGDACYLPRAKPERFEPKLRQSQNG